MRTHIRTSRDRSAKALAGEHLNRFQEYVPASAIVETALVIGQRARRAFLMPDLSVRYRDGHRTTGGSFDNGFARFVTVMLCKIVLSCKHQVEPGVLGFGVGLFIPDAIVILAEQVKPLRFCSSGKKNRIGSISVDIVESFNDQIK